MRIKPSYLGLPELDGLETSLYYLETDSAEETTFCLQKAYDSAVDASRLFGQHGGRQSLEQALEQVRDARAGSVVLMVDPEGGSVTLGLTIEQSENLIDWTKIDGEMTHTIPIPDGKKFYPFALDK